MKEFMNKFMKKYRDGGANPELEHIFVKVADEVRDHLGERPFHLTRGLNAPVFDAVFVAFALRRAAVPDDVRLRYEQLLNDTEFQKFTHRATTDVDAVRTRIQKASELLFWVG